jgi:mono/diheme cytochrome c family protein
MIRQSVSIGSICIGLVCGCSSTIDSSGTEAVESTQSAASVNAGEKQFDKPRGNGRACGTCHVKGEHRRLSPANVEARLAADPNDPLFDAIDADNPLACPLTFNNLRHGLVRIKLRLPDNVDLIQVPPASTAVEPNGAAQAWWAAKVVPGSRLGDSLPPGKLPEIVTPADRTIEVWRSVPGIDNTAFSGRFLFDGREGTLEDQALGAFKLHSQLNNIGNGVLKNIADFERTQFSSQRVAGVFAALTAEANRQGLSLFNADGSTNLAVVDNVPKPEDTDPSFTTGRDVYARFCTACHGKATDDRVENEAVRAGLFFDVHPDGNVKFQPLPGLGIQIPVNVPRPGNEFLNIGTSLITYFAQLAKETGITPPLPSLNQSADFPRYRLRFYTDGTRTQMVTDLPPLVVHDPANVALPLVNPDGSLTVGQNFAPQGWTTDPGRALITGDHADFEGMNIPQLRGIANTAPYFHDNSMPTLAAVIDTYSRFILPFIPQLNPLGVPPGVDAMTPAERTALLDFLTHF